MDKRYQVFVSSTYKDLREERAEVMQALLELDCMPAGMELFPAASEEQWKWISRVIEESDYYIVIVGGRYGTIHPQHLKSYTELEYRHAVNLGKPTIAFLHGSPGDIPASKTERNIELSQNLSDFRGYCEQRLCKYWTSASDLGGKVSRSMTQLIRRSPAIGWVRGDRSGEAEHTTILELKLENAELIEKLKRAKSPADATPYELSSGDDPVQISYSIDTQVAKLNKRGIRYWTAGGSEWNEAESTWNKILRILGSVLLGTPDSHEIALALNAACKRHAIEVSQLDEGCMISAAHISTDTLSLIKTQLIALQIITIEREGYRQVWALTDAGRRIIFDQIAQKKGVGTQRAARRKPKPSKRRAD